MDFDDTLLRGLGGAVTPQTWIGECLRVHSADGAAVVAEGSPDDAGTRAVTYTTDDTAAAVADLQYAVGIGPHAESMADGRPHAAHVHDTRDCDRWTTLVDELHRLGVVAVRTFPIGPPSRPLGTLQMHWCTGSASEVDTTAVAVVISRRLELLTPRLSPLRDRVVVDAVLDSTDDGFDHGTVNMAIGVLMARHSLAPSAAAAMLRADAYSNADSVTARARALLDALDE
ncbi:hypothetical protein [Rhodococcus sp. MEB064]|uniref:hypothetical protein n=1 Tax=Rhodococcus sp. MEB064 TaxID=1587522 RepID=UPI0005AC74B9|nr:hypothetical protein [Rhodococcus sp. MEB064]KIQ17537.1 hypothetical protein RU01_10255 [Rhodococcus sp. MEB064]